MPPRRSLRNLATATALVALLAGCTAADRRARVAADDGYAVSLADQRRDDSHAVVAAFRARSYRPGQRARLVVWTPIRRVRVQLFRVGPASVRGVGFDELRGLPVSRPQLRSRRRPGGRWTLRVAVPRAASGLYFARLRAGRRLGFAPFVLRPPRLGSSRVLVVLPTNTWQAYNFRDVDGNGVGDTWYASPGIHVVRLDRPFLDRGVPPHFRAYDAAFAGWLLRSGHRVDMLADDDLDAVPDGEFLARRYDLVIFAGHEEYVTRHMYDVVDRYRDLGGNLAFL